MATSSFGSVSLLCLSLAEKTYVEKSVVKKLVLRAYTVGKIKPIFKKEDLVGKTVLILRGYSYGGWIRFIKDPSNRVKYIEFDSHKDAFKGLSLWSKNRKPCYLLNYRYPSETAPSATAVQDIRYNDISSFNIHFVVTKQMPGAKAVLEKIENAFLLLQQGT